MSSFLLGTILGGLAVKYSREIIKGVLKGGIRASRKLAEMQQEVREDLEDLAAEAKQEMREGP